MVGLWGTERAELGAAGQSWGQPGSLHTLAGLAGGGAGFWGAGVVCSLVQLPQLSVLTPRFHDRGDSEGCGWDDPGVHPGHPAAGLPHLLHHVGVHDCHSHLPGHVRTPLFLCNCVGCGSGAVWYHAKIPIKM